MTAEEYLIRQRVYPNIPDSDETNKVRIWMVGYAQLKVNEAVSELNLEIEQLKSELDRVNRKIERSDFLLSAGRIKNATD